MISQNAASKIEARRETLASQTAYIHGLAILATEEQDAKKIERPYVEAWARSHYALGSAAL
jgi:hypothetical protein